MLSYALAIAVALSSLVLFLTAFVMSDIHRKDDFLWSGVGLLYALILWFCARNITGTVLLGQVAASILLISFCWQTLKLRKAIANPERASEISNFSVLQATMGLLNRKKSQPQAVTTPPENEAIEKVEESKKISVPNTTSKDTASSVEAEIKTNQPEVIEETKSDAKIDENTENTTVETTDKSSIETPTETTETEVEPIADIVVENQESETIAENKPQESVTVDNTIPETPQQPETIEEVKPETTPVETTPESNPENQENSAKDIVPETPEVTNEPSIVETSPKIEDTPTTNNPETPTEKAENQPSPLDSLETVEVAEVLEADPENISRETTSDRNNIIEVKTTEIEPNIKNKDSEEP